MILAIELRLVDDCYSQTNEELLVQMQKSRTLRIKSPRLLHVRNDLPNVLRTLWLAAVGRTQQRS